MIISLNWLKKYVDIDLPVDELVELIGARLVEVEGVTYIGDKYEGVIVADVVQSEPIADSDHLSHVFIDDGGVVKDVERDGRGLVQVVCGAPNVRAGIKVAWLPPGSVVPSTYNSADPFKLVAKDLKGVKSYGMLASAQELDLYADHTGILEIDKDVAAGASLRDAYELDDYLLDIENKSLTHRPDAFGMIGFAREVAAIQGKEFITPEWLAETEPLFNKAEDSAYGLSVKIDDRSTCDRYLAVVMNDVKTDGRTPVEVQTYLARVGLRPISPVVDVTNYLMMLTGQPLHAFDYDKVVKVAGGKADIHVRLAKNGEELKTLDGRTLKLDAEDIVIAAGETAIGLAGAMGGANTEIDADTKNIIIESATFNLYNLRATQMRHGIFSEAITRFTKGQPAMLSAPVLAEALELMGTWAGAVQVSSVAEAATIRQKELAIEVTINKINSVLGSAFNQTQVGEILQNAEFAVVESSHNLLIVSPPYWRQDIHIAEDIIEEVGRAQGFDSINPTLPTRDLTPIGPSAFDRFRFALRASLERIGANETLNYSFVHGDSIKRANQRLENSYRIVNSVSPDLQYYRQSLTPSLLDLVHPNVKQGYDRFALFEINKTHAKSAGVDKDKVPVETDAVGLVITDARQEVTMFYEAKAVLVEVAARLGLELSVRPMTKCEHDCCSIFELKRAGHVYSGDTFIGVVGEYKRSVTRSFKLPSSTAGFELDSRAMFDAKLPAGSSYTKLSRYQGTARDICFKVDASTEYAAVTTSAEGALKNTAVEWSLEPVDIYMPDDATTKNITIRINLTAHDHTLTSDEANQLMEQVSQAVVKATGAEVI